MVNGKLFALFQGNSHKGKVSALRVSIVSYTKLNSSPDLFADFN